jgi:hypothetical protein
VFAASPQGTLTHSACRRIEDSATFFVILVIPAIPVHTLKVNTQFLQGALSKAACIDRACCEYLVTGVS